MQIDIVVNNLLRLIKGSPAEVKYVPHFFENTLKLTLGKVSPSVI